MTEKIIVVTAIIIFALEMGFWLEGDYSLSAIFIKRFVIIEESYIKRHMGNNGIEEYIETRFYPKRINTLFFIPVDTVGIDLMTTLNYKQNFCLTLEEAQEAIKKYIIFKKTKGIKVHKYKEPKEEKKESMTVYTNSSGIPDITKCAELILPKRDKK